MAELFTSGRIVDVVLGVIALEAVGLLAYARLRGRGPVVRLALVHLLAGTALLVGLRAVIAGGHWAWLAVALTAALGAHLLEWHALWRLAQAHKTGPRS